MYDSVSECMNHTLYNTPSYTRIHFHTLYDTIHTLYDTFIHFHTLYNTLHTFYDTLSYTFIHFHTTLQYTSIQFTIHFIHFTITLIHCACARNGEENEPRNVSIVSWTLSVSTTKCDSDNPIYTYLPGT